MRLCFVVALMLTIAFFSYIADATTINVNNQTFLHPTNNTTIGFYTNMSFTNLTVDAGYILLNNTTIMIDGTNTTNVTISIFNDSDDVYEFIVYSPDPSNVVTFNFTTNKSSTQFQILRNGSLYATVTTDAQGWLNWTYDGGFSTWTFTFQPAPAETPTPTKTPAKTPKAPYVPPLNPEPTKSLIESFIDGFVSFIGFIVGLATQHIWLTIALLLALLVWLVWSKEES